MSANYYLPIFPGLLDRKHREQIGSAIWVFLWFIDKTTDEEQGKGHVLKGEALPISRIAAELGEDERTIRRHIDRLEKFEYLEKLDRGIGKACGYAVMKSKKWPSRTPDKNVLGVTATPDKNVRTPRTEMSETPDKNVLANKEEHKNTNNTIEVLADSVVIGLPLKSGIDYQVRPEELPELERLYPAVDVRQQLRSMRGWLLANPDRRKTRTGSPRFIHNWLNSSQKKSKLGELANGNGNSKSEAIRANGRAALERRKARYLANGETGESAGGIPDHETTIH